MKNTDNHSTDKDLVTVTPQQSIEEVTKLMKEHDIGAIPVIENGQISSIVTIALTKSQELDE
ncbi:CBS domain-containing protein [Evansella sp. AB-P1]|uniref:CBS domain-containing protein n=1 Tax=Evansella sp. AB-P1 TaxID=3037653 RepID=UPI00241D10AB|nr:CBS domain-containing protein [Evansella sp. AB-P1]MDG5788488.1 CBS domain-containing protein [Evansella sp. AB-P1]